MYLSFSNHPKDTRCFSCGRNWVSRYSFSSLVRTWPAKTVSASAIIAVTSKHNLSSVGLTNIAAALNNQKPAVLTHLLHLAELGVVQRIHESNERSVSYQVKSPIREYIMFRHPDWLDLIQIKREEEKESGVIQTK